jgi:hypothetical protein
VDEILGYPTEHLNYFLNDTLGASLQEDWTFESDSKGYSIQPIVSTDDSGTKIISVIFAIYRDDSSEVGQIVYNPSNGFLANSKHFQWNELNFNFGNKEEAVEVKEVNTEATEQKTEEFVSKKEDEILPKVEENKTDEEIKTNK